MAGSTASGSPLDEFCGSTFWDLDVTWNTYQPDFTECFHQTVLVWIPTGLLLLLTPVVVYQVAASKDRDIPWRWTNISKLAVNVLLVLLSCVSLGKNIADGANGVNDVYGAFYLASSLFVATYLLSLALFVAQQRRGIQSSGSLVAFWLTATVCGGFTFGHRFVGAPSFDEAPFAFVWTMIHFPLLVLMLLLNCFADPDPCYRHGYDAADNPSPEASASVLSQLLYVWFEKLAWKGYRQPLDADALWDLSRETMSAGIVPRFDKQFAKTLDQRQRKVAKMAETKETKPGVEPKKVTVSILPALARAFGADFMVGVLLKLANDLIIFVNPILLGLLTDFVESDDEESWKGYLYAFLLTVTATFLTVINSQYFQRMFVIGFQVRTSLVSAIYRKALTMSNSARKDSTVGEIVNLMSVDAQRLMDLMAYFNLIWSSPLQMALCIYFLYNIIGVATFAGLAVLILLIPINGVIGNATKKLQIEQMKNKDKRIKMMNEILSGVKVLKLYAWEDSFQKKVEDIRLNEMKVLKKSAYLSALIQFVWTTAPYLVSLVSFMTFVLIDEANVLTPKIAFQSLTLFNIMRFPMTVLPLMIIQYIQAGVSVKRLNAFINKEELDEGAVQHDPNANYALEAEKASFAWGPNEPPCLKNINLSVKAGQLIAVVGQVGSGKSSLVSALLGEMDKLGGRVNTTGRVAYVPQQAWIQNCTLRDNITFGKTPDEDHYQKVVQACALKPDLEMLPGGDSTEIGEKGINLSGGQKQRVSLARAVYADRDLYFLDDPLSAVDSHVGKHIFEQVIGPQGLLKNKTRLLVTHGITYLPQVDQIIVLKDGEISEVGSYKELLTQKGAFAEFLLQHLDEGADDAHDDLVEIKMQLENSLGKAEFQRQISRRRSELSESHSESDQPPRIMASPERSLSRTSSTTSLEKNGSLRRRSVKDRSKSTDGATAAAPVIVPARNQKLIEVEKTETGKVKLEVYTHYLRSIGAAMTCLTLLLYVVYQGFSMSSNIWLSIWSSAANNSEPAVRDLYLGVYGALGFGQAASVMAAAVLMSLSMLRASSVLHTSLLAAVLRLPMAYFDTTPTGRLLNRFSKDVDAVDNTLPFILRGWVTTLLSVLSTIIVIGYATPYFFIIVLPVGVVYYWIQHIYVATSRQLKRMESVSRSPIYSHFSETLTGAPVIRAYGQEARFMDESDRLVDKNQVSYYPSIIANRWLSVRLETIGNLIVLFAALFAVIGRDTLDPGLAGLSISYALNVTQTLNWFMRMTSEVETNIVAVERIKEYCETVQEASWEKGKVEVSQEWPDQGNISFNDYQVRYREGLDLVLKGISCNIQGGEKVGIVGRTGAGKSSLTLGLFRIIEAAGGSIVIDGVNIADLGLHALRSRLTIIPQDPVLFSGTLRMNLDPFNKYSDDQVWTALEHAHLKAFVKSLPAGLEHEASEGGENLSVGQRQLICLARALLRKTKVLVLDEATAAVDLETDDLIQATIRAEFKDCTVVTIAHRLNTIMDSNRVMVLDKGEIREFAAPADLLADKQTIFYGMAKDAGLV